MGQSRSKPNTQQINTAINKKPAQPLSKGGGGSGIGRLEKQGKS